MTLRQRAFVWLQHLLPQALLTRLAGAFARRAIPGLTPWVIRRFIHVYNVDMNEALEPAPEAYPTFNAFFTRALRDDARPLAPEPALLSPCDGTVSELGELANGMLVQAKGVRYSATELLGSEAAAERFSNGHFITIYLAPADYHRVHMPASGTLRSVGYVPGSLYSVNPATVAARPGLFARNERVTCLLDGLGGQFAMVLVGAMIVGGIRTPWAGRLTARSVEPWQLNTDMPVTLARGAEMGTFELGSTVILLFEPGQVTLDGSLQPGDRVRMGQPLGNRQQASDSRD